MTSAIATSVADATRVGMFSRQAHIAPCAARITNAGLVA